MQTFVDVTGIGDDIKYLDIGLTEIREFFTYRTASLSLSYSDNINSYYKIAGFTVFRNFNYLSISRSTYDILAFLGDVGGLEGILILIGGFVIARLTSFLVVFLYIPYLYFTRTTSDDSSVTKSIVLRRKLVKLMQQQSMRQTLEMDNLQDIPERKKKSMKNNIIKLLRNEHEFKSPSLF